MADSNPLSLLVAIKFIDLLATDFTEWEAYRLGLIDADGKKVRKPQTPEEKRLFRSWYNLVRNIKRSLATVPGGKSKFASYATAFSLLRESMGTDDQTESLIAEALDPGGERLVVESTDPYHSIPSGSYYVAEGASKLMLEEEGKSLFFYTRGITPDHTPFGPVYRHIDTDRRIHVCRHQIAQL